MISKIHQELIERRYKPMVSSERAIEKLKDELVNRFSNLGIGFRVCQDQDSTGNPRLSLKLDKVSPEDEITEHLGVQLILDPANARKLSDMQLDYIDGPGGGFVLTNI
jgi:Fe-S cluster assembly iron-binding protein IscA